MNKLLIACLFAGIVSCKEISYHEAQPEGKASLATVPTQLQGMYLLSDEKGTSKDTLVISANGYRVVTDRKENLLGDSLVLKAYKGYYFLSINENPEWLLRIVKRDANGDLLYYSMDVDEKNFNATLRNLTKEVRVDSLIVNGEQLYQIRPSAKQLMKLIKKGYFKRTLVMHKIAS